MFKNVGGVDRAVRVVAGLGILCLAFIGPRTAWGYLGLVPITTGLIGWCPAYLPFGIKTCRINPGK
ncbi:MAG: YgaP family membrane protein [Sulfuricaulis sp.]